MGAVVPGEVPVNLIKIVIRESMSQGVMNVRVSTLRRCRVCESWLCPSARLCEDLLRLKRVAEGLSGEGYLHGRRRKNRMAGSCQRASTMSSWCLNEKTKTNVKMDADRLRCVPA